MRPREARVFAGERYRLPSGRIVQVDKVFNGCAETGASCRYVGWFGIEQPSHGDEVTLAVRFMEKFARRVWA